MVDKPIEDHVISLSDDDTSDKYDKDASVYVLAKTLSITDGNASYVHPISTDARYDELRMPLCDKDLNIVRQIMGRASKTSCASFGKTEGLTVSGAAIYTLNPRTWLNDDVIDIYFRKLQSRDEQIGSNSLHHMKNIFLPSRFITALFSNDNNQFDIQNCCYANVVTFKALRGHDIFDCHRIFVSVNISSNHWTLIVINMLEKTVKYYDNYHDEDEDLVYSHCEEPLLRGIEYFLNEEWKYRNRCPWRDGLSWNYIQCSTVTTPKQENGFDCGVFICVEADLLSQGHTIEQLCQDDLKHTREKMVASLLTNSLVQ